MKRARALSSTQVDRARLFEISESRISRLMAGARLSVANCLKLADLTGEEPARVLRTYGYPAAAEALERAYERLGKVPKKQADVGQRFARLTSDMQRWVLESIALAEKASGRLPGLPDTPARQEDARETHGAGEDAVAGARKIRKRR